jgi:hypothetical protein
VAKRGDRFLSILIVTVLQKICHFFLWVKRLADAIEKIEEHLEEIKESLSKIE